MDNDYIEQQLYVLSNALKTLEVLTAECNDEIVIDTIKTLKNNAMFLELYYEEIYCNE